MEEEVGFLGDFGGHEVVAAGETVEGVDCEGVVGGFVAFPDWVAEGGGDAVLDVGVAGCGCGGCF